MSGSEGAMSLCAAQRPKVCEESLAAHRERLGELRALVARIAADVGLEAAAPLRGELDALGHRLEDVRASLTALVHAAEGHAARRANLHRAARTLADLRQSLSLVEEAEANDTEEKLAGLRDHLLALGKSEGQIHDAKGQTFDLRPVEKETSILEILELWQTVFRETFQQYHRLSTQLVKSQDGIAALKLWQEYLSYVESFLSDSIPEDYLNLKEQQHLCEIHQNLLITQKSILVTKNGDCIKEGKITDSMVDDAVMERFSSLTNLHNETLSKIIERHSEISDRIAAWDKYKFDQDEILQWLKDMEREREKLQLRYIHIRRVPKILYKIQSMLDKIPNGTLKSKNLLEQQNILLRFCDDALAASIRMEYTGISKRIENLQAGLETWRDYIKKIMTLISEYETQTESVQSTIFNVQKVIPQQSDVEPKSRSETKNLLDNLREARKTMANMIKDLDNLGVIQEQLKDCVSPQDNKTISQRIWIFRQQQADLDHQLSVLIHQLEENLELNLLFDSRHSRFLIWISDLEMRMERDSKLGISRGLKPEDLLHKLESDLKSEMALKEREIEWITKTGQDLINACGTDEKNQQTILQDKINTIKKKWSNLQQVGSMRTKKIRDLLQTILQLELRLSDIRQWLTMTESQLSKPLYIENLSKETFDSKMGEHDNLQKTIEKQSEEIGDVLNLCELLLNDIDTWNANFDIQNIKSSAENVDRRWKAICAQSAKQKQRIVSLWKLLQELVRLSKEEEAWLQCQENIIVDIESSIESLNDDQISSVIDKLENLLNEVNSREPALQILEQGYSKVVKTSGLEPENLQLIVSVVRKIIMRWRNLSPSASALLNELRKDPELHRRFIDAHGKAIVGLTQIDAQLTHVQHLPQRINNLKQKNQQLEDVENELQTYNELLQNTDDLGLVLMQRCTKDEQKDIQEMIDEYQSLWKDIQIRITQIKLDIQKQMSGTRREVDESIQVETLKFEQDTAVQVDTLSPLSKMTSITSKDAFMFELTTAISECVQNLNSLEKIVTTPEPKEATPELSTISKTISKLTANCRSNVELIQHLSNVLLSECDCDEDESRVLEIKMLTERYESLLILARKREQQIKSLRSPFIDAYSFSCEHEAGRLTCPLCSQRNWNQLDNDLWRLEQWLHFAEGTQNAQTSLPTNIEQLEDIIQDHREFLLNLDSHKSIIVSLNIVGVHLADHTEDIDRANRLRARLESDNVRWDTVCKNATKWQTRLQLALMSNKDFHATIDELYDWLEKTENTIRSSEPVDLTAEKSIITAKYDKFSELRGDLERCEPRVVSLQEAADQLLRSEDAPEGSSTIYKKLVCRLTEVRLRLQSLRRLTGMYVLKLGAVLGRGQLDFATDQDGTLSALSRDLLEKTGPSSFSSTVRRKSEQQTDDDVDIGVLQRSYRFLGRVVRASLPFQALLLLLLGAAALAPTHREDMCALTNNFATSLEPMLRYPDGPPPV